MATDSKEDDPDAELIKAVQVLTAERLKSPVLSSLVDRHSNTIGTVGKLVIEWRERAADVKNGEESRLLHKMADELEVILGHKPGTFVRIGGRK